MYKCPLCNETFSRKENVKKHTDRVHLKKYKDSAPCDQCNFKASNKESVLKHKQKEHEGKTTKCDQCGIHGKD